MANITIENADLAFKNFAGAEGRFNDEGKRNFCVILEAEDAKTLAEAGVNIKRLKPRNEGDEEQPYVKVNVNFNSRQPPRVVMINSRGRTNLDESTINILDWSRFTNVDLIANLYRRDNDTPATLYLSSIYCTIEEDELELKYANVPESAQSVATDECFGDDCPVPGVEE